MMRLELDLKLIDQAVLIFPRFTNLRRAFAPNILLIQFNCDLCFGLFRDNNNYEGPLRRIY